MCNVSACCGRVGSFLANNFIGPKNGYVEVTREYNKDGKYTESVNGQPGVKWQVNQLSCVIADCRQTQEGDGKKIYITGLDREKFQQVLPGLVAGYTLVVAAIGIVALAAWPVMVKS
jgi:hypothetical protein